MASPTLFTWGTAVDSLLATTLSNYRETMEDNIYTALPLTHWLNSKGRKRTEDGGASLIVPLMSGKNTTAAWYSGYGTIDTTPQEGMLAAQFKWTQLADSVTISGIEVRQNTESHRLINLLKSRTLQAETGLIDKMSQALWSTTQVTNAITPLDILVATTGTVGDIASSGNAFWQATSTASGSFAAQGISDMRTLYNTLSKYRANDHPDLVVATQTIYESYENATQAQLRYTDTKLADAGFEQLKFKGATFFFDENAIANELFMLNSKYLELVADKEVNFTASPWVKPDNQDAKTSQILWYGQLTTSNRRTSGKLTAVTA